LSKAILILGASSPIARAAAHAFAAQGHFLYLAGRDLVDLERIAADIKVRYQTEVSYGYFAAEDYDTHDLFLQRVVKQMHGLEGVLLAFGDLKEQKKSLIDFEYAKHLIEVNYVGACSILTHCCNYFGQKGKGFILALSSVAGDRGRQSNYVYGSAKGGLSLFLQGLRNRLQPTGVRVITIKLGLVDTSMTFGSVNSFLMITPQYAGKKIADSLNGWQDIVYIPWFWRYIMLLIKAIPESLFKRLKL
jgi:decaprenylphospho-beta-D-erythro-pentofuranosid-2-ulose 2-reductase